MQLPSAGADDGFPSLPTALVGELERLHAVLEILPEHEPYYLQLVLVEKNPQPYTNLELYP